MPSDNYYVVLKLFLNGLLTKEIGSLQVQYGTEVDCFWLIKRKINLILTSDATKLNIT